MRALVTPARLLLVMPWLPGAALALQPLDTFVESARRWSPDNAEARANLAQTVAQSTATLGRALPALTARAAATRNEYSVSLPGGAAAILFAGIVPPPGAPVPAPVVLSPYNGLDGTMTLTVPIFNVAAFTGIAATQEGNKAAREQVKAVGLQVESQVVQGYFQLVAAQALVTASRKALEVARVNLDLTRARFEGGKAAALDVDRAVAEVERQAQILTASELQVELAARALQSATGVTPEVASERPLSDDLHPEPPLEAFSPPDAELPQVAAAISTRRAQEGLATAAKLTLVPALNGSLTEHGTNAPGFQVHEWAYQAVAALTWSLDVTTIANIQAQDAAADAARAREERTSLATRDAIHRAWATVGAAIARSRSARAQESASAHASALAQDRYEAGAATQLDLLQAQRDAFQAEVARIQTDADLANARLQLRLASGKDPFALRGTP